MVLYELNYGTLPVLAESGSDYLKEIKHVASLRSIRAAVEQAGLQNYLNPDPKQRDFKLAEVTQASIEVRERNGVAHKFLSDGRGRIRVRRNSNLSSDISDLVTYVEVQRKGALEFKESQEARPQNVFLVQCDITSHDKRPQFRSINIVEDDLIKLTEWLSQRAKGSPEHLRRQSNESRDIFFDLDIGGVEAMWYQQQEEVAKRIADCALQAKAHKLHKKLEPILSNGNADEESDSEERPDDRKKVFENLGFGSSNFWSSNGNPRDRL
jgi:hypothetical protein